MSSRICALLTSAVCLAWSLPAASQTGPLPSVRISLGLNGVSLLWPTNAAAYVLERADSLGPSPTWVPQTNGLRTTGTNLVFDIGDPANSAFYRLHRVSSGPGIDAPLLTWTWVPFNDCYCMEGTATGLGVNLATNSNEVLIYLMGGGACWDYATCYLLNTATHGPFGETEFTNLLSQIQQTWFLDRSSASNPFQKYSYVLVPYCTGDLHAGSRVDVYNGNVTMQVGFENMASYLKRLAPTFAGATHIVLAGSSAGGYGATFNWLQTQQAFPAARVDLIDDSGPIFTSDVLAQGFDLFLPGSQPMTNWNFQACLPPGCATCGSNVSSLYGFINSTVPAHRIALLSYTQDQTIRGYLGLSALQFSSGLTELSAAQFDSSTNTARFFIAGQSHVLLFNPTLAVNGVTLQQFITQMVTDDPVWKSP